MSKLNKPREILFVSHCILNTAAKVVLFNQAAIDAEEALRMRFLTTAIRRGVQLVQLPCPEFTLYGSRRWGTLQRPVRQSLLPPALPGVPGARNRPAA